MDIQLYFEERGGGFPLILLHGNGEDSGYFIHQMSFFSEFYHVYAIDTRGHGKSPRGTAEFSIHQFAEDLLVFLHQHHISKAHFLGFSDGGNIALTFALKYPQYVEKLILNGANLNPNGVKWSAQFPIVLGYHIAGLFKSTEAICHAEMLRLMVKEPNIQPKTLQSLHMPVLVIAGDHDMIKDSHTRQIAEYLPNSQLSILHGDHFIANKRPNDFNSIVEKFLKNP